MQKVKFIKLTKYRDGNPIYLNPSMIGNIFISENEDCTIVGHLTHNNGGFRVKETPEKVLKLINELENN